MADVIAALRVLYEELGHARAASGPRTDTLWESPSGGAYALKTMDGVIPKLELGSVRVSSDVINWPTFNGAVRRDKVAAAPGARWTSLVLLFSTVGGEPLAILPDGYVQRMRVGGTSAIALDLMARRTVKTLAILGSAGRPGGAAADPARRVRATHARRRTVRDRARPHGAAHREDAGDHRLGRPSR